MVVRFVHERLSSADLVEDTPAVDS